MRMQFVPTISYRLIPKDKLILERNTEKKQTQMPITYTGLCADQRTSNMKSNLSDMSNRLLAD